MCKVCGENEKETWLIGYLLHIIKALLGGSELFLWLRMTMNLKSCKTPKPMQLKECLASSQMGELSTELCPAGRRRSEGLCQGKLRFQPGLMEQMAARTPRAPLVLRAAGPSGGRQSRLQKVLKRDDEKSCFKFLLLKSSVLGVKTSDVCASSSIRPSSTFKSI